MSDTKTDDLTAPQLSVRQAFEAFMLTREAPSSAAKKLTTYEGGEYAHPHTARHWFTWQKATEFSAAIIQSQAAEIERMRPDAERYQCIRRVTGAGRDIGGRVSFVLPVIDCVKGANLLRGSVAQHFDEAVDAIRTTTQPKG